MKKKYILPGIISLTTFLFTTLLFCYTDLKSLTVWTLNIWDNLFTTGNFRSFYEYSAMNLYGLDHQMVGSDILIYIPWALWNLPIWLLQRFAGYDAVYHAFPLLWSKLFLIVIFVLCFIPVKSIAKKICDNSDEAFLRIFFLSCSSLFTITSLAYVGQNDVMVIFAFLMALSSLLNSNKSGFIIWSAISIAFKPFFVFSYIAIILLKEKDLLKIIRDIALGFSIYFIQKIPFLGAYMYKESLAYGPTKGAFGLLFSSILDIAPAGASLFVLCLGALYLAIYFKDSAENIRNTDFIYCATAPTIIFFMFSRYESYRPFYLIPLLFLLMLAKPQYNRINLLLEFASTSCLMAYYLLDDTLFYNANFIWFKSEWVNYPSISEIFTKGIPGLGYKAFTAIYILCMVLILVINHPDFKYENKILCEKEETWLMPLRSVIYSMPLVISLIIKLIR